MTYPRAATPFEVAVAWLVILAAILGLVSVVYLAAIAVLT